MIWFCSTLFNLLSAGAQGGAFGPADPPPPGGGLPARHVVPMALSAAWLKKYGGTWTTKLPDGSTPLSVKAMWLKLFNGIRIQAVNKGSGAPTRP